MRALLPIGLAMLALCACGGSAANDGPPSNDAGTAPDTSTDVPPPAQEAGGGNAGPDAGPPPDNGAPSDVYPAPHPAPPQVIDLGGPTMKAPKIVPVFFPNEPFADQIQQYVNTVGATDYYKANAGEFGVGAATGMPAIQLTETAANAISDDQIQTWLSDKITSNAPGFVADADTLFVLFYPAGTSITLQGEKSCDTFGGYHSNVTIGGKDQAYAVIPRCDSGGADTMTGIDLVTGSSSHEILEAVTDPFPQSHPAYATVDEEHAFWQFFIGGGEDGDMCAQNPGAFYKPAGYDFTVQRSWSNKEARAGHDPCVPNLPSEVYFNSAPVLPDPVNLAGYKMKGVKIPVGQTKTVEVDLFSDAKTSGPWTVKALDDQEIQGGTPGLSFAWDRTTGVNGEKLHLSITVLKASQYKAEGFFVISKLGGQTQLWLGLVAN